MINVEGAGDGRRCIAVDGRPAQRIGFGVPRVSRGHIRELSEIDPPWKILYVVDPRLSIDGLCKRSVDEFLFVKAWRMLVPGVYEMFILPRQIRFRHIDVFHGMDYLIPNSRDIRSTIATFHDSSVFTEFDARPELSKRWLRAIFRRCAEVATAVHVISEAARAQLSSAIPAVQCKAKTIWNSVDHIFYERVSSRDIAVALAKGGISAPFILYYGGFKPNKNVMHLLRVFAEVVPRVACQLVIVGKPAYIPQALRVEANALNIASRIRWYGFASDRELAALLHACAAFAYPSLFEGFGLPAAEAIVCGAPIVCCDSGAVSEVVGDAGIALCGRDLPAWRDALVNVVTSGRLADALRARSRRRAHLFHPSRRAREFHAFYTDLLLASQERTRT